MKWDERITEKVKKIIALAEKHNQTIGVRNSMKSIIEFCKHTKDEKEIIPHVRERIRSHCAINDTPHPAMEELEQLINLKG